MVPLRCHGGDVRLCCSLLTLIGVLSCQEPPNRAEDVFVKFEQKLLKAKSFQAEYESKVTKDRQDAIITRGMIVVAGSKRLKVTASEKRGSSSSSTVIALNGKELCLTSDSRGKSTNDKRPALQDQAYLFAIHLSRVGMPFDVSARGGLGTDPRRSHEIVLSSFKLLSDENAGGNQPIEVQFELVPPKDHELPNVKRRMWFDNQTGFLTKRHYETRIGEHVYGLLESYSNWQFDLELDDEEFKVK